MPPGHSPRCWKRRRSFILSLSIDRAGRRLELLHRRAREAERIRFFVRRDEQLEAIRDLVNGPNDQWALHLVGGGGVGKTMLLRHLSVTMADELGAAVARVDFDYLTADYPSHAPGELLWNFEEELRLRDESGETEAQFKKANDYLRRLHGELAAGGASTTAEALASPLLQNAISEYISALQPLPRVILVLDTCEELLRVRPGRSADENIDATFRILRALHDGPQTLDGGPPSERDGLPNLRVILAGRRPLASEGPAGRPTRPCRHDRSCDCCRCVASPPRKPKRLPARHPDRSPADLVEPILERAPGDVVGWRSAARRGRWPAPLQPVRPVALCGLGLGGSAAVRERSSGPRRRRSTSNAASWRAFAIRRSSC